MHSFLPADFLVLANNIILYNGDSHANFNIRTSASGPVQMYFHAKPITSKTTTALILHHQNVTQERILQYEEGLQGAGQQSESVEVFIQERMSLHRVEQTANDKPVCDCKDFTRLFECAHSIVYRETINGENILNTELGALAVKRRTGKKVWYNGRGANGTEAGITKSAKRSRV